MTDEVRDPHKPLRDDVSMLGGMLGDTLRAREAPGLFDTVERIRRIAKAARAEDGHALGSLEEPLRALPLDMAVPVARAFSHFLTLANIAEEHHRVRRRRDYLRNPSTPPQPAPSPRPSGACWRRASRRMRSTRWSSRCGWRSS